MSQTKYKLDNNRRGIVIRYCRLYNDYLHSDMEQQRKIALVIGECRALVGADIHSDNIKDKLRYAIWQSTLNARDYPYEVHDLPAISRNEFYERKRKFILTVAHLLGI